MFHIRKSCKGAGVEVPHVLKFSLFQMEYDREDKSSNFILQFRQLWLLLEYCKLLFPVSWRQKLVGSYVQLGKDKIGYVLN